MKKTKSDRADLVPDVYVMDNGDYYGEVASAKPTAAANAYPTKNKVRIKVLCFYLIDLN